MQGYGAIGQQRINDLLREASHEREARQTRRYRATQRRSLARVVSAALQGIARH
jgi:hypothetical protein